MRNGSRWHGIGRASEACGATGRRDLSALCSIGFINYHESPLDMLYGALAGGLVMLAAAAAGRFVSKKDTLGTGDVKLMASLGFVLGFVD